MRARESRCYENNVCLGRLTHPISWSVMTILARLLCLCLALMTFLLSAAPLSFSFLTKASLKPSGVERVNSWTRKADQRREDCYYEALAFSRHSIDLELDEQNMKPEKATKAPEKCRNRSRYHENEKNDGTRNKLAKGMSLSFNRQVIARAMQAPLLERTEHPVRHGNHSKMTKRGLR